MIDIHTHILPGVDDGASDLRKAVAMLRRACEQGTREVILTPHLAPAYGYFNFDREKLDRSYDQLCRIVYEVEKLPVVLHTGMEVLYEGRKEMLYYKDEYITLCHSPYLLMEFYFDTSPEMFLEGIDTAGECGFIPVVAHPERYACVIEDPKLVIIGKYSGALFQANKSSFSGFHGHKTGKTLSRLMDMKLIDFVASDAHDLTERNPGLDRVRSFVANRYSPLRAETLFEKNAKKITAYGEHRSPSEERKHA